MTTSDAIDLIAQRAFKEAELHACQLRGSTLSEAHAEFNDMGAYEREIREEAMEVALRALTAQDLETLLERKRTFG